MTRSRKGQPASNTRTFLVSGAASGIGKHMALALANKGERVTMLDVNGEALAAVLRDHGLAAAPNVLSCVHDVRDAAGWERVIDETVRRFGGLDVMLNIAGYLKPGYLQAIDANEIDKHVDINVKGIMLATAAGARVMLRQGSGHIVNIASIAGISHVPGLALYCATKHAVRGFSLSVAHELAPHGVHVSVVCPDAVETPMLPLQDAYEEAAMTFGGGRALSLDEIERALFRVLDRRPLELVLPVPGSGRGALAKLANMFPTLGKRGIDRVRAAGRKVQARRTSAAP